MFCLRYAVACFLGALVIAILSTLAWADGGCSGGVSVHSEYRFSSVARESISPDGLKTISSLPGSYSVLAWYCLCINGRCEAFFNTDPDGYYDDGKCDWVLRHDPPKPDWWECTVGTGCP